MRITQANIFLLAMLDTDKNHFSLISIGTKE